MPIQVINFENNILHIEESGRLDANDAKQFEHMLLEFANASLTPIVVLIDARKVDLIMPDANRGFLRAASVPNVKEHVVASKGLIVTQAARILGMRNTKRNTVVFESWEDALAHAQLVAQTVARA